MRKLTSVVKSKSLRESQRKSGPGGAGPISITNSPWWNPYCKEDQAAEEGGHAQQEEVQEGAEQAADVHGLWIDGSSGI